MIDWISYRSGRAIVNAQAKKSCRNTVNGYIAIDGIHLTPEMTSILRPPGIEARVLRGAIRGLEELGKSNQNPLLSGIYPDPRFGKIVLDQKTERNHNIG